MVFFKVVHQQNKLRSLLSKDNVKGVSGTSIRGITQDDNGNIYIAREVKQWYKWNKAQEKLDTIYLKDKQQKIVSSWSRSFNLIYENETLWGSVCIDNNRIDCQLVKHDLAQNKTSWFDPNAGISTIAKKENGGIWVGLEYDKLNGGIAFFDTKEQLFSPIPNLSNDLFKNRKPTVILEDANDNLWVGTINGLIRLNQQTGKVDLFEVQQDIDHSLSSNYIISLQERSPDQMLVGTLGGLDIIDNKTLKINHLSKNNGLSDNRVCGIIPADSGNYWISTYHGLNYLDWRTQSFRNYYQKDGLTHNEFNRFSAFKDSQNTYYFGGINGLNVFDSEDLIQKKIVPTPLLTKVTKYDRKQDSIYTYNKGMHQVQEINLSPYDTDLKLDFVLPLFHEPLQHQFSTFLEGYDKNWAMMSNTSFVNYNTLPAGNYTLNIKGMDELGNWSKDPLQIKINVQEIYYKQLWFQFLILLLGTLLAYTLTRYWLLQKLKTEQLRTKISSDLHDEVSGLLAGIALQSEMLQYRIEDKKNASKAENIANISRSAMSRMSDVLWSIDARKDTISDLLLRMKQHLRESLTPLDINYTFTVNNLDEKKNIKVVQRENIYFIFKEAINNIVKHAQTEEVKVIIGNIDGSFQMRIENKGIAANDEPIKTGQGLLNMQMRAKKMNAQIQILRNKNFTILLTQQKPI